MVELTYEWLRVSRELSLLLLVHDDINFTHRFPYRPHFGYDEPKVLRPTITPANSKPTKLPGQKEEREKAFREGRQLRGRERERERERKCMG